MAAYIRKIKDGSNTIYPITDSKAVYYNADETLSSTLDIIAGGGSINDRVTQLLGEMEVYRQKILSQEYKTPVLCYKEQESFPDNWFAWSGSIPIKYYDGVPESIKGYCYSKEKIYYEIYQNKDFSNIVYKGEIKEFTLFQIVYDLEQILFNKYQSSANKDSFCSLSTEFLDITDTSIKELNHLKFSYGGDGMLEADNIMYDELEKTITNVNYLSIFLEKRDEKLYLPKLYLPQT